jgi:hypothetical protein
MLISDLEYLDSVDRESSFNGGETIQAFSGAVAVVASLLLDAPPEISVYNRSSTSSKSLVINDYAYTNSTSNVEFGILK